MSSRVTDEGSKGSVVDLFPSRADASRVRSRIAIALLVVVVSACASSTKATVLRTDGSGGPIAFVASQPKPPPTEIVSDVVTPPDPTDIYWVAPDGSGLRRITTDGDPKGPLAWSPDGQTLAYTASPLSTRKAQLWLIDASGENKRMVCAGCGGAFDVPGPDGEYGAPLYWVPRMIAWSPDGRWIASTASGGGFALIEPASGKVDPVPGPEIGGLSWSPDSSSVAFTEGQKGLDVYDLSSGKIRQLTPSVRGVVGPVAWSPDGSAIVYADSDTGEGAIRQGVFAVDPSGQDPRTLMPDRSTFGVYDLEWSPDGSRLAVMYHPIDPPTAGLLTMASDGSDVRQVAICENGEDPDGLCPTNGAPVVWSPDGAQLLFDNYPGSGHAFTAAATDGSSTAVSEGLVPGCCIAWQPQ